MADEQSKKRQPDALPLNERDRRPTVVTRVHFEELLERKPVPYSELIPIEAARNGDGQVFAAREPGKTSTPRIELDALRDISSVDSVVTSTSVSAASTIPNVRELLYVGWNATLPEQQTFDHLPALDTLFAPVSPMNAKLRLDRLPEGMLRLAIPRSVFSSMEDLKHFPRMRALRLLHPLPTDSLGPLAQLRDLRYVSIGGRVKEWAALVECEALEEAHLYHFSASNFRRYRTWKQLRVLAFSCGVQSLAGIESFSALERLTMIMSRLSDLSPLQALPRLEHVRMTFMKQCRDLSPLALVPSLRKLEIDQPIITNRDIVSIDSLRPLARCPHLEEIVLMGTRIVDGDLTPLAEIPSLRKVRLGPDIGANATVLRELRPDVELIAAVPDPHVNSNEETIGSVVIRKPGGGLKEWSIFDDLTELTGTSTNYAAESAIRRAVRSSDPELLARLSFDTEGGAVGIYAGQEQDIRAVAAVINGLANGRGE